MAIENLIWLIPLPPLLAFFLIVLFTHRSRALSHWLALIGAGLAWLASMIIFFNVMGIKDLAQHPLSSVINWLPTCQISLQIGVQVDPLTAISLFFVAWTVFMIFIYSVAYHNYGQPKGDHDHPGCRRTEPPWKPATGTATKSRPSNRCIRAFLLLSVCLPLACLPWWSAIIC